MTLAVSRAFMVGLDKKKKPSRHSSQASGLASRFKESMNVHRGTGVNTEVTLNQSVLYFTCFILVNNIILQNKVYTKIYLQVDKNSNKVEKKKRILHNNFNSWKCSFSLCTGEAVRRGSSLFRYQFATARGVRLGILKVSLYLSSTARHFRLIQVRSCMAQYQDNISVFLIDFFKLYKELKYFYFKAEWLKLLTNSNTFRANCSTRIAYNVMYIYSYTVSVCVKQLYKSKVYTVCLLINIILNLN